MAVLNNKSVQYLKEILDETALPSNNFKIEVGDGINSGFLVRLEFKGNPSFYYVLGQNFHARILPGEKFSEGEIVSIDLDSAFNRTKIWIGYIIANLKAGSPMSRWEETWSMFQKNLEEQQLDEKAYFTQEEKEDILSRLSKVESDLKKVFTENNATAPEIEQLEATFNELETTVDYVPKMTWYRSCIGKVSTYGRKFVNSPIGSALLVKAGEIGVTKLLGP
jgi:hypothetical protein